MYIDVKNPYIWKHNDDGELGQWFRGHDGTPVIRQGASAIYHFLAGIARTKSPELAITLVTDEMNKFYATNEGAIEIQPSMPQIHKLSDTVLSTDYIATQPMTQEPSGNITQLTMDQAQDYVAYAFLYMINQGDNLTQAVAKNLQHWNPVDQNYLLQAITYAVYKVMTRDFPAPPPKYNPSADPHFQCIHCTGGAVIFPPVLMTLHPAVETFFETLPFGVQTALPSIFLTLGCLLAGVCSLERCGGRNQVVYRGGPAITPEQKAIRARQWACFFDGTVLFSWQSWIPAMQTYILPSMLSPTMVGLVTSNCLQLTVLASVGLGSYKLTQCMQERGYCLDSPLATIAEKLKSCLTCGRHSVYTSIE